MRVSRRGALALGALGLAAAAVAIVLLWPAFERGQAPPRDPDARDAPVAPTSSGPAVRIRPTPVPEDDPEEDPDDLEAASRVSPGADLGLMSYLRGVVVDSANGEPISAMVYAFPVVSGAPESRPREQMLTGVPPGEFFFALLPPTPPEWILAASARGRVPATLRTAVPPGTSKEGLRLVLDLGLAIEGIVRVDGAPAATGDVRAELESDDAGANEVRDLQWNAGGFRRKMAWADVDDHGGFSLTGLAAGTYRISASNPVDAGPQLMGEVVHVVTAPASGIVLEFESATLTIEVLGNGRPLPDAQIQFQPLDADGWIRNYPPVPFSVRVRPGVPHTIAAAHVGFEERRVEVPPLAQRETRHVGVTLTPSRAPELRLTLQGASALSLPSVAVSFLPITPIADEPSAAMQEVRRALRAERVRGDEYVIARVPYPPGRYLVVVVPGREEFLVPAEAEIALPEHGSVAAALRAVMGGRLAVVALDTEGNHLPCELAVRDPDGVELLARTYDGSLIRPSALGDARSALAVLRATRGILPPGRYEIEASRFFFETVRRKVDVVAGKTVTEEVRLERK